MPTIAPPVMELSDRVNSIKPSATLGVTARVRELKAKGIDVIGFGAGQPDFDTPDNIKQAAIDALQGGMTGYAPVPGDPEARKAIATKLQRENNIACTADDIVISTGAKHSIYLALQCLLDHGKGQEVIIPAPAWVSYFAMTELAGGTVVEVPCSADQDFKMTPAQLADAITPNTRALLINSPSNPCGTMYTPDELRALAEVLEPREQVTVISDEIYEKLIFGDCEHLSLGSLPQLAGRTITVNGMSKAFAMTGWRVGYACAPIAAPENGGPSPMARAIAKLQGQMTTSIVNFVHPAIVEALQNGAEAVEEMRKTFARRATFIHGLVQAMPDLTCPKPTGAFYVFPDVSAHFGKTTPDDRTIDSSVAFAEALLEEARVAVVPGDDFGTIGRNHVRMSYACGEENIAEGCQRMHEWLETLD